jgi:2,6-dihydroxypyridine 3-monooxygenase
VGTPGEGLRVAVVGGSLGGLLTALELGAVGCDVHVYERSSVPLEGRGAGIVLHPVTTRLLERRRSIDLDRVGSSATILRYLGPSGAPVLDEPVAYRFTSYATLHAALAGALEPGRYHLDRRLVATEPAVDGRVRARFADGSSVVADLVVGADGIRSTVRALLFPRVGPSYAGYVAWRGTVGDRELPPSARGLRGMLTYHVGHRTHMLAYEIPVPGHDAARSMNWVWYRNLDEGALGALLTDRAGVAHDLSLPPGAVGDGFVRALIADAGILPPAFRDLVAATGAPFLQVIVDLAVPAMVRGRVCLLGDAAFSLRPHAAVGTAKAADDARALASAISTAGGDLPAALRTWEAERLRVGRAAARRSRAIGERAQFLGSFSPGDPAVAFGLRAPKDGSYADLAGRGRGVHSRG